MRNKRRILVSSFLLILLVLVGFYRDFLFKSINALLKARDFEMDYSMPDGLHFTENWSDHSLQLAKWVLTMVFTAVYFTLTLIAIRTLFGRSRAFYFTLLPYLFLIALSGLSMLVGFLFANFSENAYEVARYLMGIAQSPLVLMILIPAMKLSAKEKTSISN